MTDTNNQLGAALDELKRLRAAERTILALIERAEGESLPAVATDKLRRALEGPQP